MTVREVFNTLMSALDKSQAELAEKIDWTPQQMSHKLKRQTLRMEEFLRILDQNGVELLLKVKDSGEIVKVRRAGHGRRLKGMSDRVIFDTGLSSALSNTFYLDGENEYDENGEAQELYEDQQGRYFIARYNATDPKKECVTAIPAGIAAAFIEKYGTDIEKKAE